MFPDSIIQVLKRLHDEVPPTPFKDVKNTIESEFNKKIEDIFESFDENALASASIGQGKNIIIIIIINIIIK